MSHPFGKTQDAGHYGPNLNAISPRRQQAIDAFPFLQGILPGTRGESRFLHVNSVTYPLTPQQREAIWDAVDQERPLLPLLSEHLGWEPWMVRHVQHHWPVFNEIDGLYARHAWDLRSLLASWTPETAPRRLAPLRRLCGLFNVDRSGGNLVRVRPFHELQKRALSAHDRCTLLEIVGDASRYRQLCDYLDFLYALTHWLSDRTGKHIGRILPRLLGAETIADWWTLCLRWHRINDDLSHERAIVDAPTGASETRSLALLTEPVNIGLYSFHNLLNPRYRPRVWASVDASQERPPSPTPCFPNTAVYVELDGIHHATLTLAICGPANAPKIRVIASLDRSDWVTLDHQTQAAVDQFVAAVNDGQLVLNQQSVNFYLSGAALRVSLLEKFQRVDYPSWLPLFPETEYFDVHTTLTGAAVFDVYRESLALVETAEDCIYQRVMAAVRRVGEPDFDYIECVCEDSARTLIGPPGYIGAPGR